LADQLAFDAGRLLLGIRKSERFVGKALGAEGDRRANQLLCDVISTVRPSDGILSEESADNLERLRHERVGTIDPLDGTREYSEGRAGWAVHVALAIDGVAEIGAVALPCIDEGIVIRSDSPGTLLEIAERPRLVVSRTRPAREVEAVASALGSQLVPMGSAGAKAMAVVRGEAEVYLHSGGQYEWDSPCGPRARPALFAHRRLAARL
jgi:3'(2'), 5'-bisphosphate nucleotidase